jgi:hypothetical protein
MPGGIMGEIMGGMPGGIMGEIMGGMPGGIMGGMPGGIMGGMMGGMRPPMGGYGFRSARGITPSPAKMVQPPPIQPATDDVAAQLAAKAHARNQAAGVEGVKAGGDREPKARLDMDLLYDTVRSLGAKPDTNAFRNSKFAAYGFSHMGNLGLIKGVR